MHFQSTLSTMIRPDHILEFQDGAVFMICEALDSMGNWRPIDAWQYTHFCGNSYYELVFPPGNFVVTRVIDYSGDYPTLLRMKLRNFDRAFYSSAFRDTINYSQFSDSKVRAYASKIISRYYRENPDSIDYYAQRYFDALVLNKPLW